MLTEAEVGEAQFSPGVLFSALGRSYRPLALGISGDYRYFRNRCPPVFYRSEPSLLLSLKRVNQGSTIELVGRVKGNMGDQ